MEEANRMREVRVSSFNEYIGVISDKFDTDTLFRGIHNKEYELVPKIGRNPYVGQFSGTNEEKLSQLQDLEENTVNQFIQLSVPYLDLRNMSSWDQWTIAQHHGVPTRFLDWTENPLIAAYFAVEGSKDTDVAVYAIDRTEFNLSSDIEDPFSIPSEDEVVLHIPSHINPRISAQKGVFTVHKDPTKPFEKTIVEASLSITKIVISQDGFTDIEKTLDWYGINRSFVYPGLDGVAAYVDLKARQQ